MQFNLVICGLDSVEARRWMNATLVNLVDPENPESLKPLIDGGTEGSFQLSLHFLELEQLYFSTQDSKDKPASFFPRLHLATNARLICSISRLLFLSARLPIPLGYQNIASNGHPF